jgi:hypothetical protein
MRADSKPQVRQVNRKTRKHMKSNATIARPAMNFASFKHLVGLAKAAGVNPGKTKASAIIAVEAAVKSGKLHVKSSVTFSTNPAKPGEPTQRMTHYGVVLRTYKSGPGLENTVVITPDNPIPGSPSV